MSSGALSSPSKSGVRLGNRGGVLAVDAPETRADQEVLTGNYSALFPATLAATLRDLIERCPSNA